MPSLDKQTFRNQDLVLKVSSNIDPHKFDINQYEAFLDALCGEREYQKEAIRETLRYLLSGGYKNLKELSEENYHINPKLQDKYASLDDFYKNLQLPDKLSCSLDMATATGKSYVMYGIARIMLSEGKVDQVLVLCPSNTIETGLSEKFRALSGDKTLKDLLPRNAKILNPSIINASETIKKEDICIENIHATYINTKSAIEDSLAGKGERTLVLNDEAHHLANPSDQAFKKWKEFLLEPKYNFKYIVGLSGTCYIGDDYFSDVIYRYPIKQAMEEGAVKLIKYVAEDSSGSEDEKFQKIYDNHIENKKIKYRKLKPLTILVTKNIAACEKLTEKLINFISKKERIAKDDASMKVLIVTSANKHKDNIQKLKTVDDKKEPVEWIISVSMLSEGWDAKNVFQIVPHEERAFNSKLLIAQVLGRGLRIPEAYKGERPLVTVFNHDKWSSSIKHLVDEVLEIEKRIHSYLVEKGEDYNFNLYNMEYKKVEKTEETPQEKEYEFKKGYITFSSQSPKVEKATTYIRALGGEQEVKKTTIEFKMYSVAEAIQEVFNKLRVIDMDLDTTYSQKFGKDKIEQIIRNSLRRIGEKKDRISQENLQKTLQAFGVVYRKKTKSLRFRIQEERLKKLNTKQIDKNSLGIGNLRRDSSIFYDEYSLNKGEAEDKKLLKDLQNDETLPISALIYIQNKYNLKTPLNIALASYKPEREFIKRLTEEENVKKIDAWIKSLDMGFYSIDYSWRKGEHPKQGSFNPDFFIKIGDDILVIEIKMDKDASEENKAKLKYARAHFNRINRFQRNQKYYFKFLSPESYDLFYQAIRTGEYRKFKSKLEASLE